MTLQKVEGFSSLRKDTANGGVVNVDKKTYEGYKMKKLVALQKMQETINTNEQVVNLEGEINTLKSELSEIKSLLLNLLEKGK